MRRLEGSGTQRRRARGFTLLEAMVAMVLVASVGAVVLSWIQQSVQSVQRLNKVYEELEARKTIEEWGRHLNPAVKPRGEAQVGDLRVEWEATETQAPMPVAGYPAGIGIYDVSLYEVAIKVYQRAEPAPWFNEKLVRIGQRKVRESRSPFSP